MSTIDRKAPIKVSAISARINFTNSLRFNCLMLTTTNRPVGRITEYLSTDIDDNLERLSLVGMEGKKTYSDHLCWYVV